MINCGDHQLLCFGKIRDTEVILPFIKRWQQYCIGDALFDGKVFQREILSTVEAIYPDLKKVFVFPEFHLPFSQPKPMSFDKNTFQEIVDEFSSEKMTQEIIDSVLNSNKRTHRLQFPFGEIIITKDGKIQNNVLLSFSGKFDKDCLHGKNPYSILSNCIKSLYKSATEEVDTILIDPNVYPDRGVLFIGDSLKKFDFFNLASGERLYFKYFLGAAGSHIFTLENLDRQNVILRTNCQAILSKLLQYIENNIKLGSGLEMQSNSFSLTFPQEETEDILHAMIGAAPYIPYIAERGIPFYRVNNKLTELRILLKANSPKDKKEKIPTERSFEVFGAYGKQSHNDVVANIAKGAKGINIDTFFESLSEELNIDPKLTKELLYELCKELTSMYDLESRKRQVDYKMMQRFYDVYALDLLPTMTPSGLKWGIIEVQVNLPGKHIIGTSAWDGKK